jgi:hypothetical protein
MFAYLQKHTAAHPPYRSLNVTKLMEYFCQDFDGAICGNEIDCESSRTFIRNVGNIPDFTASRRRNRASHGSD